MNNEIIDRISSIEASAASVMEEANARKKEYAAQMEKRTAEFDTELEAETEEKIDGLRRKMIGDIDLKLKEQQAKAAHTIEDLDKNYELHHKSYVEKLFYSMIKE